MGTELKDMRFAIYINNNDALKSLNQMDSETKKLEDSLQKLVTQGKAETAEYTEKNAMLKKLAEEKAKVTKESALLERQIISLEERGKQETKGYADKKLKLEALRISEAQLTEQGNKLLLEQQALIDSEKRFTKEYQEAKKALDIKKNAMKDLTKEAGLNALSSNQLKSLVRSLNAEWGKAIPGSEQRQKLEHELEIVRNRQKEIAIGAVQVHNAIKDMIPAKNPLLEFFKKPIAYGLSYFGLDTIVSGVQTGIKTITEFDKSLAGLRAITGVTRKESEYFAQSAIDSSIKHGIAAKDIVEAYKLMGSARTELLKNSQALKTMTDSAIVLSEASGLELPDSVTRLASAMAQLKIPTSQAAKVVDILAAASMAGAAEVPDITDSLVKFGSVAKLANIDIKECAALIETLADSSIKGAEGGDKMRNIILALIAPEALGEKAQSYLRKFNVNLNTISDTSLPFAKRLEELNKIMIANVPATEKATALTEIFGKENVTAATALLQSLPAYQKYEKEVNAVGISHKQAAENMDTLAKKTEMMGTKWDSYWLSVKAGNGAIGGLISLFLTLSTTLMDGVMQGSENWFNYIKSGFQEMKRMVGQFEGMNSAEVNKLKETVKMYDEYNKKFADSFARNNTDGRITILRRLNKEVQDNMELTKIQDSDYYRALYQSRVDNANAQIKIAMGIEDEEAKLRKASADDQAKIDNEIATKKAERKKTAIEKQKEADDKYQRLQSSQRDKETEALHKWLEDLDKLNEEYGSKGNSNKLTANQKEIKAVQDKYDKLIAQEIKFKHDQELLLEDPKIKGTARTAIEGNVKKAGDNITEGEAEKQNAVHKIELRQQEDFNTKMIVLEDRIKAIKLGNIETEEQKINEKYRKLSLEQEGSKNKEVELARIEKARVDEIDAYKTNKAKELQVELDRIRAEIDMKGMTQDQIELARIDQKYDLLKLKEGITADQITQIEKDAADERAAYEKQKSLETARQVGQTLVQAAQTIANAVFQIQAQNRQYEFDGKMNKINTLRDAELENEHLTSAQRKAIMKKYAAEEKKLKEENWKANQKAAITQAFINGALAITNIMATAPVLTWAFAIPMSIIATGAQIAVIKNQKMPQFAKGRFPVTGADDGVTYNAGFGGKAQAGLTNSPSVFLAGEKGPEMIVPFPQTRQLVMNYPGIVEALKMGTLPNYANGRFPQSTVTTNNTKEMFADPNMLAAINRLNTHLDNGLNIYFDQRKIQKLTLEQEKVKSLENGVSLT